MFQFIQSAQEFLLPKLKQKYYLWCCGDDNRKNDDDDSMTLYDDLNLQELDGDHPKIKQVSWDFVKSCQLIGR